LLALQPDDTEDSAFVQLAYSIIEGAVAVHRPKSFHVTKIDHWFDHKWKGFSGKVVGAVGSWRKELTIPPFVQNRIIEQWQFERLGDSERYGLATSAPEIHHQGCSEDNLRRSARRVAPDAALFWYSGDTLTTDRGSLMGYIPVEEEYWTWYLVASNERTNGAFCVAREFTNTKSRCFSNVGVSGPRSNPTASREPTNAARRCPRPEISTQRETTNLTNSTNQE
jgi:hypothetical protein